MDKMESNIANVTKTNKLLQEKISAQEQNTVSLHPDSSENQGADLGEEVRPISEELCPVNTEIDVTTGEVVIDQAEAMSTVQYSLVAGLFNQNSPATSAVVEITKLCLEADNENEVIHSKDVVVKTIDAATLLGKANHQMTFKRKERLKNALSED